jgi:hypothetical protein
MGKFILKEGPQKAQAAQKDHVVILSAAKNPAEPPHREIASKIDLDSSLRSE